MNNKYISQIIEKESKFIAEFNLNGFQIKNIRDEYGNELEETYFNQGIVREQCLKSLTILNFLKSNVIPVEFTAYITKNTNSEGLEFKNVSFN